MRSLDLLMLFGKMWDDGDKMHNSQLHTRTHRQTHARTHTHNHAAFNHNFKKKS